MVLCKKTDLHLRMRWSPLQCGEHGLRPEKGTMKDEQTTEATTVASAAPETEKDKAQTPAGITVKVTEPGTGMLIIRAMREAHEIAKGSKNVELFKLLPTHIPNLEQLEEIRSQIMQSYLHACYLDNDTAAASYFEAFAILSIDKAGFCLRCCKSDVMNCIPNNDAFQLWRRTFFKKVLQTALLHCTDADLKGVFIALCRQDYIDVNHGQRAAAFKELDKENPIPLNKLILLIETFGESGLNSAAYGGMERAVIQAFTIRMRENVDVELLKCMVELSQHQKDLSPAAYEYLCTQGVNAIVLRERNARTLRNALHLVIPQRCQVTKYDYCDSSSCCIWINLTNKDDWGRIEQIKRDAERAVRNQFIPKHLWTHIILYFHSEGRGERHTIDLAKP
jgi:hypothetical protein